jgi:hypothetical protein
MNVCIVDAKVVGQATLNQTPPAGVGFQFKGLVDTGAQRTMISTNVVQQIGMRPITKVPLRGVGHEPTWHNAFLFHVGFIIANMPTPGSTAPPTAMVHLNTIPINGAEITSTAGLFDVLLGMDIIGTGSLKVEGSGTFSFSF